MNTINPISTNTKVNFKASRVNIVSIADMHGSILSVPQVIKSIQVHSKGLYEKAAESSTLNLLALSGDVFMNPKKYGFLSLPQFCAGDIQYNFLTALIYKVKTFVTSQKKFSSKDNNEGKKNLENSNVSLEIPKSNFETIFTLGNHDLEGGDTWIFDKLMRAPMLTILSNIDQEKSPLVKKLMAKEDSKIVTSKVFEIPDTRKGRKNRLLVLGATIPSMDYYCPNMLRETEFYDNSNKNDASLSARNLRKTFAILKQEVDAFKLKYPKGAVILMSHMGNKISRMIAERIPEINLILNGHDHKSFSDLVGKTLILSHGQNCEFYQGIHMDIDTDGVVKIHSDKYETQPYDQPARKDKGIQLFVNANVRKDLEPYCRFDITKVNREELVLTNSIRYSNNIMANYITSALRDEARKVYRDLDVVGVPSTIFRNGLLSHEKRTTINNIDYLKIFDGVNAELAELRIGTVTGKELYDLVLENVLNNLKSKTRNALIQWSDIRIDRTLIKSLEKDLENPRLREAIQIRNKETGEFEMIDLGKEYKMILSDKYLLKSTKNVRVPEQIQERFVETGFTYDILFMNYLKSINFDINLDSDEVREKRII